ncbi:MULTISPECIES: hypothetical protein [Staphylococcus]|uniref:hypothetical protein n=1 Tax=Staphylococcus TaxID=1279 RepID=UPI001932516E|nr:MULTISPECIES: hypothetical protein [Staphylococcus]MCG3214923.1 hypothetical protein [Staphylococcus epidermidis]
MHGTNLVKTDSLSKLSSGWSIMVLLQSKKYSITCYFIAISFVVIFATFSSAYLDTKISGDNDRKS